ncbi:hypothetical protein AA0Z99_08650 [Agrococcus sp. 1P02AA]|uniref:hypothetical protein n=1 Tax=Agrococcus sp. 1P02AA TaxID=3132259 RepID=UPI0039A41791
MSGQGPAGAGQPEDAADATRAASTDAGAGDAVAGDAAADDVAHPPLVIRRRGRRVSTEPPPGYTGEPSQERQQSSENDARLRADVPPHWG